MPAAEMLAPPDDDALEALVGLSEPAAIPPVEEFTPGFDAETNHGYTYTRADGTVEYAATAEEVIRRCPVLGSMPVEKANVWLKLSEQGKAQAAEEAVKRTQVAEPQPAERQKPERTIQQHEKLTPAVTAQEKKINKPVTASPPEVKAAKVTPNNPPKRIEAPEVVTRSTEKVLTDQHLEQAAPDIADKQPQPVVAEAVSVAAVTAEAFKSTRSETPGPITQVTAVHATAEATPESIRRQSTERIAPERIEPITAPIELTVDPTVLLREHVAQMAAPITEVRQDISAAAELDNTVELTLPPVVERQVLTPLDLDGHFRAEPLEPEADELAEARADTLDEVNIAHANDAAEARLAQLVTGVDALESEGEVLAANQDLAEFAPPSEEPEAAATLAEQQPAQPPAVSEAAAVTTEAAPQPAIDSWEAVLADEPEPKAVLETFAEVLQAVAELPAPPVESQATDESLELAPDGSLTAEPQPELPPVPTITLEIAVRLTELKTPEKVTVEPIIQELVVAIRDLQIAETQEMDETVIGVRQEELEELCEELLEAIGVAYDEEEIRQFIRLISSRAFQPSLIAPQDATPFLEHISTREVKRQISTFTSSLADLELELEQLLGKFVLHRATGLLKQPGPDSILA